MCTHTHSVDAVAIYRRALRSIRASRIQPNSISICVVMLAFRYFPVSQKTTKWQYVCYLMLSMCRAQAGHLIIIFFGTTIISRPMNSKRSPTNYAIHMYGVRAVCPYRHLPTMHTWSRSELVIISLKRTTTGISAFNRTSNHTRAGLFMSNLVYHSGEGSAQSSNGESGERTTTHLSRAVSIHPDAAQVMYFA
jgi:hypothetical protein